MANTANFITRTATAATATTVVCTSGAGQVIPAGSLVSLRLAKDGTGVPTSVIDSVNGSGVPYILAASDTSSKYVAVYYLVTTVALAAGTSWTATFATTTNRFMDVEWIAAPGATITPQVANASGTGTAVATAAIVPAWQDSYCTSIEVDAGAASATPAASWTEVSDSVVTSAVSHVETQARILTASASLAAGATLVTSQAWQQIFVVFPIKPPAPAPIDVMTGASMDPTAATTVVGTFSAAVPVGDLVDVMFVGNAAGVTTGQTLVDSAGNTWTLIHAISNSSMTGGATIWRYRSILTHAITTSTTVTATYPSSMSGRGIWATRIQNIDATTPVDTAVTTGVSSGASASTAPSAPATSTQTQTGNWIGVFGLSNRSTTGDGKSSTPSAGWTETFDSGNLIGATTFEKQQTTSAVTTNSATKGQATISATSVWVCSTVIYRVIPSAAISVGPTIIAGSDTGTETDTQTTLASTLSGTDSATVTETSSTAVTVPTNTDTATETDTQTALAAVLAGTDTVIGTSAQAALSASLPGSDTGTMAETSSLGMSGSDTGTGTDTGTLSATFPGTDTATGTSAGTLSATLPGTDTATIADNGTLVAQPVGSDAGTVTQAQVTLTVTLSGSDSATTTENSVLNTGNTVTGTDNDVSFVDTGTLAASIPGSDSGTVTESSGVVSITGTDTATVVEGTPQIALSSSDTAIGTSAGTLSATLPGSDSATESDTPGTLGIVSSDTGTVTQTGTLTAILTGSDSATSSETGTPVQLVAGSDTGIGTETGGTTNALSSSDSGSVVETWAISATLTGADNGTSSSTDNVANSGSNISGTDSFTVAESSSIVVILSSADSFHTTESGTLAVTLTGTDSAVSTQAGVTSVTFTQADSAHWTDSGQVLANIAGSQSATTVESSSVGLSSTDIAHGIEGSTIDLSFVDGDQVVFNETGTVLALIGDIDQFIVEDVGTVGAPVVLAQLVPVNRIVSVIRVNSRSMSATLTPVNQVVAILSPVELAAILEKQ